MEKMETILLLIALCSAFLAIFILDIRSEFIIIFILIGGISVLAGFTIGMRRTLRELKDFMKGDDESNKNQDDN